MRKSNKRAHILQALEKTLKNRRFDEVTIDEVAEAAGVGKGTVYRYFEDKEDLFFQMVRDNLDAQVEAVHAVAAGPLPPRDKLIQAAETMSEHMSRHVASVRMMHAPPFARRKPGTRELMREHHQKLNAVLTRILKKASEEGILRPDVDIAHALCLYKGMIVDRTMAAMYRRAELPVDELVELLLRGMGT